ncbi:MAG TPA: aspartyl/asparaginyl beta-hydroxylase domain-containing protein [Allosphingosinicella sp.]|jgi:aspartyl/asparaginyl beta-hydroxylase (cupin superfamily)
MPNFIRIAEGLDVAPALADITGHPEHWVRLGGDTLLTIQLLDHGYERQLEAELPEVWRLVDRILVILAAEHGDKGRLCHARIGLMPSGEGLPPHFDGIDGITRRRYQLALISEPGVTLTVGGEEKWPRPGEAWRIEASRTHSVQNDSQADRITLLFDTRD